MPLCTNAGRNGAVPEERERNGRRWTRCGATSAARVRRSWCLSHEPNVAETQVAQAPMDELGRRARGAGAEVIGVDERDVEPARAAWAAVAAPITPPPITSRSNDLVASASRAAVRRSVAASAATAGLSTPGGPPGRRPRAARTSPREVEPRGDDPAVGGHLEDVRAVPVAEPAGVYRSAARLPHEQRDRARGRASTTTLSSVVSTSWISAPDAAVEAAFAKGVEDALVAALGPDHVHA